MQFVRALFRAQDAHIVHLASIYCCYYTTAAATILLLLATMHLSGFLRERCYWASIVANSAPMGAKLPYKQIHARTTRTFYIHQKTIFLMIFAVQICLVFPLSRSVA